MAYTEFLVTKGSSASDTNGGSAAGGAGDVGANDGPIYNSTDVDSDGVGTTLTDNSGSDWGTAAADDWLCFDTAGTPEYVRIVSKPTASTVTVTPAVAINATTKDVNVGGAWATIDHAINTVTVSTLNAASDNPCINLAPGTYTEAATTGSAGSTSVPLRLEGYESAFHDGVPSGASSRPLITTTTTTSISLRIDHSTWQVCNVNCSASGTTDCSALYAGASADGSHFSNIEASTTGAGTAGAIRVASNGNSMVFVNVHSVATGGTCVGWDIDGISTLIGCSAVGCAGDGVDKGGSSIEASFVDCVFSGNGGHGLQIHGEMRSIVGCTFSNNVSDGLNFSDGQDQETGNVTACIFSNNGGYGISITNGVGLQMIDWNAYYSNTSGEVNNVPNRGASEITLTAVPHTDESTDDYSLNATAGGGAACRDLIPWGNSSYRDLGGVGHQDAGGGGGSTVFRRVPITIGSGR